jgi:hypothetical protein
LELQLDYRLTGLGWAECTVSDENASCTITASYLGDALGNLVSAACAALRYFNRVSFSFEEEPGEYRWVIQSPRLNEIELRIYEFAESWGSKPDDQGTLIFQTKCLPITFARAVHAAATRIHTEQGETGYLNQWSEHPFPMLPLRELERLLALEH